MGLLAVLCVVLTGALRLYYKLQTIYLLEKIHHHIFPQFIYLFEPTVKPLLSCHPREISN